MKPRLAVALLLWVIGVHLMPAQDQVVSTGPLSIILLFDLSYSMSLPLTGGEQTRLEFAQEAAEGIIAATAGRAQWALLGFEDNGSILGSLQYTTFITDIEQRISELIPWGRSPLRNSLYQILEQVEGPAQVVVFSDLLETEQPPQRTIATEPSNADTERLAIVATDRSLKISVLFPKLDTPAQAIEFAELLANTTGGGVYEFSNVAAAVARIAGTSSPSSPMELAAEEPTPLSQTDSEGSEESPPSATPVPAATSKPKTGGTVTPHEGIPDRLRDADSLDRTANRSTTRHLSWVLFGIAGLSAAYVLYRIIGWLRTPVAPPQPLFAFHVTGTDYEATDHRIGSFPVTIGNGAGSTIRLSSPFPGRAGRSADVRIDRESARAVYSSNASYNVNGVGKRHKVLKDGDRIRYGRYTIEFRGLQWQRPPEPVSKPHLRYVALPFAAIALAVVFRVDAVESAFQLDVAPPPERQQIVAQSTDVPPTDTAVEPEAYEEALGEDREVIDAPSVGAAGPDITSVWFPETGLLNDTPKTARFPNLPTDLDLDVLFIHAHPDDESLDYGAMAAAASAEGLKTGVLLFTDGNAGLDQYPWREVDHRYPARRMSDDELLAVRIGEAQRAMGRLGVDLYIRLGLVNHPYSGIVEQLTIQETVRRWGGFDYLVDVIASTIAKLTPELVVSPDIPSEASEHFEHEAAGIITREALNRLGPSTPVRAHLAPVDPLQTDAYSDVRSFEAWKPLSPNTQQRYRDAQLAALREHRTQRDASVIGIEVRQGLRYEYYRVLSWRLSVGPPSGSFKLLFHAVEEG